MGSWKAWQLSSLSSSLPGSFRGLSSVLRYLRATRCFVGDRSTMVNQTNLKAGSWWFPKGLSPMKDSDKSPPNPENTHLKAGHVVLSGNLHPRNTPKGSTHAPFVPAPMKSGESMEVHGVGFQPDPVIRWRRRARIEIQPSQPLRISTKRLICL